MNLYVGVDISKGYADSCVIDDEGTVREEYRLDDTRSGHDQAQELAQEWDGTVSSEEELLVGMEATGRTERNWLDLFEQIADKTEPEAYCAGPLVLRRFAEQRRLHAGKTDRISARLMADYLRFGGVETDSEGTGKSHQPGLRTLSRKTKELIGRATQPKKRAACSWRAHPERAQHVRGHMSQWVLKLIKRHPTPDEVVEAGVETVAEIPYVTEERAREVIDNARSSVAGQTDPDTGLALSMVAEDLLRLEKRIDRP